VLICILKTDTINDLFL